MGIHINERGSHTTVIEGAKNVLKLLKKIEVSVAPGVIEGNVKAKGKSVKLKKVNSETFEMVVVVGSSKQTFKVYGREQKRIIKTVEMLRKENWHVLGVMDVSGAR